MKFFIDTANLDEIAEAKSWGCLAGVTTNPSLYAKTGGKLADFEPHMLKIAELCEGLPVSAESTATTAEGMIEEGKRLAALAPNIVVKLPVCEAGLAACRALADAGVRVNMTLVFSPTQALMAANAGARYISPFVGRFDDIAEDGISQLDNVVTCIKNYDWTGKNRIQARRRVTLGEHKAIAIGLVRVGRIDIHFLKVQIRHDVGSTERSTRVSRPGRVNRSHDTLPDLIGDLRQLLVGHTNSSLENNPGTG